MPIKKAKKVVKKVKDVIKRQWNKNQAYRNKHATTPDDLLYGNREFTN
jgi:hypothetical protein